MWLFGKWRLIVLIPDGFELFVAGLCSLCLVQHAGEFRVQGPMTWAGNIRRSGIISLHPERLSFSCRRQKFN